MAQLMMLLWVKMGFSKDVNAGVPGPVPFDDLPFMLVTLAK